MSLTMIIRSLTEQPYINVMGDYNYVTDIIDVFAGGMDKEMPEP